MTDIIPGRKDAIERVEVVETSSGSRTVKAECRLLLKQNLVMIPLMCLGYFFGYLDRGQIGNARLMGLQEDLNLSDHQYYNAVMMFFVGFLITELPAALLMRAIPAQYVFGGAITLFGLSSTLISVASDYAGLMVLRVLLGVGEAVSALSFLYLSLWYKPYELALASSLAYLSAPVAGFASGLIAYGVQGHLDQNLGLSSWQWLFVIVGIPAILLGLTISFVLPDFPDRVIATGHFLFPSNAELELIRQRTVSGQNTVGSKVDTSQIVAGLMDLKTYLAAATVAPLAAGITAFTIFLPTFIHEFGFSNLNAQLFTIIPYTCGIIATPSVSYLSDRLQRKAFPLLGCLLTGMTGFIILLASTNTAVLIFGCCLVAAGSYPGIGIAASWIASIHGGYTKRGTALGIGQIIVQAYCIVGSQIYDTPPRFLKGHGIFLGLLALGAASLIVLYAWLKRENDRREKLLQEKEGTDEYLRWKESSFEDQYEYHPFWKYTL